MQIKDIKLTIDILSKEIKPFNDKQEYTVANIFNKEYDENFLSYWFAYIFNPKLIGTTEFLQDILHLANYDSEISANDVLEVEREHSFENDRRIDILITTKNETIAIENKVFAPCSENQLVDYSSELNAKYNDKEIIKIVLFPSSNGYKDVIKKQADDSGFTCVYYEDLLKIIKNHHINMISNIRNAFMIDELIVYLENYICKEKSTMNKNLDKLCLCKEKAEDINSILSFRDDSNKILTDLLEETISKVVNDGWDKYIQSNAKYIQLFKANWNRTYIHFELLPQSKEEFPYSTFNLVFHVERSGGIKQGREKLEECKNNFSKYLVDKNYPSKYIIDYSSSDNLEESIKYMMEQFFEVSKEYSIEIDETLKEVVFE